MVVRLDLYTYIAFYIESKICKLTCGGSYLATTNHVLYTGIMCCRNLCNFKCSLTLYLN